MGVPSNQELREGGWDSVISCGCSERIRDPVPPSGAALIFEELLTGAGLWIRDDGEYLSP